MPTSLHSERQHRIPDAQPAIDRVNALLDRFDVDAIESIWNPEPLPAASEALPAALQPNPTPQAGKGAVPREQTLLDERAMADAFSNRYLLPLFDPPPDAPLPIDPAVAVRLDASYCREHKIAPLAEEEQTLEVAIAFPEALQLADEFSRRYGKQLRPLFAPQSVIERILDLLYPGEPINHSPRLSRPASPQIVPADDETRERLIHDLLAVALKRQATAIHFDQIGDDCHVRFRIDGRLTIWKKIAATQIAAIQLGLQSRAKLDTADRTSPQSGSFQIRKGSQRMTVCLDTCPTVEGHRTVLHFQRPANSLCTLSEIGLDIRQCSAVHRWLSKEPGLILVSSPPGHGTTTTLYSLVSELEQPEASVATVEAKVERRLARIQQLQIDPPNGMALSDGLRVLLKQDLDVMMVGKLEDVESLDLCFQGCSAGSTVLAGLPAQSPLALIRQLLGWGIDRWRLTEELHGLIFQRLLRRLCFHCRRPHALERSQRQRYGIPLDIEVYRPVGCRHCSGRGYSGRLALFELLDRDSELLRLVASDVPAEHFQDARLATASRLSQAAMGRVIAGETSLAEGMRLIGGQFCV